MWVAAASVLGPGLPGWESSLPVLRGEAAWADAPLTLPPPAALPPTERRRTSQAVRLALAVGTEAASLSGLAPDSLDTVFASSNGDGQVVGSILEELSRPDGAISPTQFHNSVHNAAAGYWGIAVGSTRPSVSVGGYDDSVATGLLTAASHVAARRVPTLLVAYDAPLTEPLASVRATGCPFAAALVLTPAPGGRVALDVETSPDEAALPQGPVATRNPAARLLPVLEALARGRAARLALPLMDGGSLAVSVIPC
ncbi:beta-ketoacyl synthase chain length factor [Roseomonas sp. CCTCC AB2023176]|uniref:beta-ketoacyl synthase chain length factor n=1 Tax=Roseomonas sp. CCTCC AB2023176 TaxID=3342640 RepID=UPI0035D80DFA